MSVIDARDRAGDESLKWAPDAQYALSQHGKIEEGWVACFCKKTGNYYPCKSIESGQANMKGIRIMRSLAGMENIGIKAVFCEENKPVYIVMERCMGQRLSERIGNEDLEADAAKLTKIIVGVIKICHEANVTLGKHLEKTFVFLNAINDCALKAVDFGDANTFGDLKKGEQKKMKERDIQSAGTILYALVTGKRLSEDDQKGIIKGQGPKSSEEISRKWHGVSEGAKSLIQKMLRKNPLTATDVLGDEWICTNGRELDVKKVIQNLKAIKIGEN